MTPRDPAQDFDPKHRIIGAVVVVVLAVILIPIILGQRESPSEPAAAQPVVAGNSAAEENKVAVTPVPPPGATMEATTSKAASVSEPKKSPVTQPPAKIETAAAKPAAASAKAQASVDAKAASSGWVVQVGTFSNTANATRMEQKLRAEGQPLLVENIRLASGTAVRLRVGPFHDRTAAVKAQERIHKEVGVQGVVLAYP